MSISQKLLILVCLFCSQVISCNPAIAEELWYTVQAGSFANQHDAESFYKTLSTKLQPQSITNLRIEFVSSYYTVRIGKFKSSKDIASLFEEIQTVVEAPLLIYAYVRPARIVWPAKETISPEQNGEPTPLAQVSKATSQKASQPQEPLFYTIQTGTFLKQDDANKLYENFTQKLPPQMLNDLRIEKVSSFFTVRFGKKSKQHEITPFLRMAQKIVADPVVIHAYIRKSRIAKSFLQKKQPHQKAAPTSNTTRKTHQPKNIATAKSKTKQSESQITDQNQDLKKKDIRHKSSATPPSPEPKPKEGKKANITIAPTKDKPSLSPEEYKKKLLAKYLATSHQTKDKAAAHKKAASFPTSENCTTSSCHTALQEISLAHFPVKENKCLACHKQLSKQHPSEGNDDFQLVTTGAALCQQCHLSIIQGAVIHPPAKEGKCLKCHAPHGSSNPFLLSVQKNKVQELCLECHDSSMSDQRYQHGPVGLGKCTFCHNPHATNYKALLIDEPKKLCFNCHSEFKKGLLNSPYIHAPVKNDDCQSCHLVHGSSFPDLLTADPHDFCFTCHTDVQKKFEKSRTKHAGLYLDKQCGTCHLAHYSPNKYLLIKNEKELCLTCHGNNSPLKSFSPKNIEKEISNKEYIHTPVAQGDCTSCHDPHGSQFDSLLVAAYPSTFYAPYDPEHYNLCFTCHDQELLSAQETEDDTNFRNGSSNLHFVHVGIKRKGRTCNACHNAHASDGPKLINRTGAKFGEWTMSISFNLTETGGSCMPGCHRKMNYDRIAPANNDQSNKELEQYYIDYKSQTQGERVLPF